MITNFPLNPRTNVGGGAAFQFSPWAFIASLPSVVNKTITSPILFKGSATLLTGYATLETLKFTETANNDVNGISYLWQVAGFIPGDSDELVALMEDMEAYEQHLVIIKDMMGISRLVGYDAPLIFTANYSPGNDTKSARGYNFVFSGSGPKRAPVYNVP